MAQKRPIPCPDHPTARTNLIRHDVKTYQDYRKYVMTYHQVLDRILSLRVIMWMEQLSLSVIDRREKLATRLCVFLKSTKTFVCLYLFRKIHSKNYSYTSIMHIN